MARRLARALLLAAAGCAAADVAPTHPGTDIPVPPGFRLVSTAGLVADDGRLTAGELVYAGPGEFRPVFRGYHAALAARGWTGLAERLDVDRARLTLRKERRSASVVAQPLDGGEVLLRIVVGPYPPPPGSRGKPDAS